MLRKKVDGMLTIITEQFGYENVVEIKSDIED